VLALVPFGRAQAQNNQGDDAIDTLKEAVAIGVNTNPATGRVQNNRRATDKELRQARGGYYPSIDLSADTGFEASDNPSTRGDLDGEDSEEHFRYQAGLTLTQMLFDGFETRYEIQRQKNRVASAAARVEETVELTGLDIVEAYLEVMRQRELLKIARENVQAHRDILAQIEEGEAAGRSTRADVEQARARLASARANVADVREELNTAEANFRQNVGDAPGDLRMPAVPVDKVAGNIQQQVERTLAESPTLDIREEDIDAARANWEKSKESFYPEVDLQLNASDAEDLGGVEGSDQSASALVTMNWNLYRGGADTARTDELVYRLSQTKEERAEEARRLARDVRRTWGQMVNAGERAQRFAEQADANREVVGAYFDQFQLDRRTLLDVLDAQNELFVSRSNTVNNEVLKTFAIYRLIALEGDLMSTLDISYPEEAVAFNQ
jgi:adhesin transport system outer membrane protein